MSVGIESPPNAAELERRFIRLRDQWKSDVVRVSSASRRVMHSAHQAIIGMGPPVLPPLFRGLEKKVDSWF